MSRRERRMKWSGSGWHRLIGSFEVRMEMEGKDGRGRRCVVVGEGSVKEGRERVGGDRDGERKGQDGRCVGRTNWEGRGSGG